MNDLRKKLLTYFSVLWIKGQSSGGVGGESQRVITWLGRSVSQIAQNAPHNQRSYPESTADFFSLPQSPMDSDGEDSETESMEKRARRLYRMTGLPESPEVIKEAKRLIYDLRII